MSNRGEDFFQQAEKALTKFRLFGKNQKWTDAAELFQKAGNSFKSIRNWTRAGDSYTRAAECLQAADQLNEAATVAADAGKMYSKQPETSAKALESFNLAVRIYRENSKPTNAARLLCEAAKVFQEQKDLDSAAKAYSDAAQLYDDENQANQAAQQLAILGDIYSEQKKWVEASNVYKDVANRRLADRLTQLAAGEYCTKSVICRMAADDVVGAESLLHEFVAAYPGWERSREYSMLDMCAKAINDRDSEAFSTALAEYDQFKRLDNWMTSTLLVVKNLIDEVDVDVT
ncbi:Alpha-soluble NSF attachment protein [Tritrichomonas foetus]|uniref:Alpha-soluble NSF attachment protein n=1 Tax=Tritrichomonas foetus TaxID=1144522 RepID=A0A1J4K0J0_9EUKA|nr:Alpha-soluble NSF attachment protein [Tritrichomonas foetus]|eukprot:OHT04945.1 Alpha-soluble NSF attachment protein [Tritrichomonas foetus]